jgi:hypothetical protein
VSLAIQLQASGQAFLPVQPCPVYIRKGDPRSRVISIARRAYTSTLELHVRRRRAIVHCGSSRILVISLGVTAGGPTICIAPLLNSTKDGFARGGVGPRANVLRSDSSLPGL